MATIKDGKVPLSDREKYRQMSVETGGILSVPPALESHFKKEGLAFKWVSKRKIAAHGGHHPTNWIPYEMSEELKEKLPKTQLGQVVRDFLERGDLILAVKPKEQQEDHRKELKRKTRQQLDSYYQEVDVKGKKILHEGEDD